MLIFKCTLAKNAVYYIIVGFCFLLASEQTSCFQVVQHPLRTTVHFDKNKLIGGQRSPQHLKGAENPSSSS